ncbi:GPI transamidase subunit PIG-U [Amanita rubescens]|nr:GPI transamidase subunit PIG-U [Amanita rubescens]
MATSRLQEFALHYGFLALAATRLALCFTDTPRLLKQDHLVSSPLTSFSNLQEGIYLFKHGINPYSGGPFRHSPLFLLVFTTVIPSHIAPLLWALCDIVGAFALVHIWRARQRTSTSTRDNLIAACYIMNPYLLFSSLALSTSALENMVVLLAVMFASHGNRSLTLLLLAVLAQVSLFYTVLLAPIAILLILGPTSRLASPYQPNISRLSIALILGQFLGFSILLTAVSALASGNWSWLSQTWGASFTLPDLTPNPGLWWYFFTEMFDHFRPFFLMVFSVHVFIYVLPFCIKFQYDPLYATFCLVGILGLFKPYPTLADFGLFISMITIFPEVYPYLRHPLVTTILHIHASLLMPLFHGLWLKQGTGNANFFYASTLVFACANGAAVIDCVWAGLRLALGPKTEKYVIIQE